VTVQRFRLDASQLDDEDFGLDGPSPAFVLDSSQLGGDGKLDGFNFTETGVASANLGGLTAVGTATIIPVVAGTATANLGELSAAATGQITHAGVAETMLGALTASATGDIDNPAVADAPLGGLVVSASAVVAVAGVAAGVLSGLSAAASAGVTVSGSAVAGLGGGSVSAVGDVSVSAVGSAVLGGIVAEAFASAGAFAVGAAQLGGLSASAVGSVVSVGPHPSGQPYPRVRRQVKKREPEVAPVVIVEELVSVVSVVSGSGRVGLGGVVSSASGAVTFSGEDDDLEVLLLV
jgi:hypothetical protein